MAPSIRSHAGGWQTIISSDGPDADDISEPTTPTPVRHANLEGPLGVFLRREDHGSPILTQRLMQGVTPFSPSPLLPLSSPEIPLALHASPGLDEHEQEHELLLPPLSSDGLIYSSPIIGNAKARDTIRRAKAAVKRRNTITENTRLKQLETTKVAFDIAETARSAKVQALDSTLDTLSEKNLTFAELMFHVFDPSNKKGVTRWAGFFQQPTNVKRILDFWVSPKNSVSGRSQVHEWAVGYISRIVKREARAITEDGFLQTVNRPIDASFVLGFNMTKIHAQLEATAATAMTIFDAFATSARQLRGVSTAREEKKKTIITSAAAQLAGEYSHGNSLVRRILSLYFYATGSQRQPLTVMSHLGVSESYTNLIAKKRIRRRKKKKSSVNYPDPILPGESPMETEALDPAPGAIPVVSDILTSEKVTIEPVPLVYTKPGTLRELSESMRDMARGIAATGLFGMSYDNINMMVRTPEQSIGRTDTQENGTCATIWPLWKARLEDMYVADIEKAFDDAPPLELEDILLTSTETATFNQCLMHTILRIIIDHGGEGFKKFRKELEASQPETAFKIELHKTDLYPLPAMNIDESTITGNAEVIDAVWDELRLTRTWKRKATGNPLGADQLSIARLRSLLNIRAGQEGGYLGFRWGIWMIGLFHGKMADGHGFFVTHWGKPNAGDRNPGSLAFHNTCLTRMPIVLTSLPPWRTCRDLIFVSLYARVLHLLLLVSEKQSLEEYAETVDSWDTLKEHAGIIFEKYTNADTVAELRWNRACAKPSASGSVTLESDMVFENAILFLRDALISREMSDAVKSGDSGRILFVLKIWALSFRGNGRTKYAYEMLHVIHNLTHIWPKAVRDIVLNNWLVNPTGNPNSWVEVDLMQEHMNFWIKNFYKAHGSAGSWEWLEMVSPCVDILRRLATAMKYQLGSDQGVAHEPVDITRDIDILMSSLDNHNVYRLQNGRILDEDDAPAVDVISLGLQSLTDSPTNPLEEYNKSFRRLQARCRQVPIVGGRPIPVAEPTLDSESRPHECTPSPAIVESPTGLSNEPSFRMSSADEVGVDVFSDDDDDAGHNGEEATDFELAMAEDHELTFSLDNLEDVALDMDIIEDLSPEDDFFSDDSDEEFELMGGTWHSDDEIDIV